MSENEKLIAELRERAEYARAEGNATAICDAIYFEKAADALSMLTAPVGGEAGVFAKLSELIHDEVQEYEFRCGGGDYIPTEGEREMLEDFGNSLLGKFEEAAAPYLRARVEPAPSADAERDAANEAIQRAAMSLGSSDEWTTQENMIADFEARLCAVIAVKEKAEAAERALAEMRERVKEAAKGRPDFAADRLRRLAALVEGESNG